MDRARQTQQRGAAVAVASGMSRRAFVAAAGTLGVTVAAMRALPASAAAASGTAAAQFLGSNAHVFVDIQSGDPAAGVPGVPGLSGVRIYGEHPKGSTNRLAPAWPTGPAPGTQGPIVYSIYPIPDTVTGTKTQSPDPKTVAAIEHLIATAPAGSYLDSWHEAFGLSYPSYITHAAMYRLHAALNDMCKGTGVTYGSIFGGGELATLFTTTPRDLGYYGLDVYGNISLTAGMQRLDSFITLAKQHASSGYPKLLIPETNAPDKTQQQKKRDAWFEAVCTRMHGYGSNSIGVLTFWGGQNAQLGGPWTQNVNNVNELNYIISNIF